jgi:hypothetical protein
MTTQLQKRHPSVFREFFTKNTKRKPNDLHHSAVEFVCCCAHDWIRTSTPLRHYPLKVACLPISPRALDIPLKGCANI